ncbi:MAG: DNA repair protein RecO [Candidatus Zambryskibacteria bacterium]|nr:DNA repair protein RecO [Candidatus Zambryskibacteria bacterium]
MYRKYHTRGIVISSKIEGGTSRRVNIFTEDLGLISAKVQGGQKLDSKLRGGSQDFSVGEFSLIRGKAGWRVVSARSGQNLFEIFRNQPEKLKIVVNILNLIKKLIDEEKKQNTLFGVIAIFFKFLEKAKQNEIALSECLTLMRILHILGYMRHDPEFTLPLSLEINPEDLRALAPRRAQITRLINESLKVT